MQAREAAAAAEAERQVLADKLDDKAARSEALAAHRASLEAEMQHLRHQMQREVSREPAGRYDRGQGLTEGRADSHRERRTRPSAPSYRSPHLSPAAALEQ